MVPAPQHTVIEYFERNAAGEWESVSKVFVPESVGSPEANNQNPTATGTATAQPTGRLRNRRGLAQNHRNGRVSGTVAAQRHRLHRRQNHPEGRRGRGASMEPNNSRTNHNNTEDMDPSIVVAVPSSSSTTASTNNQQPQALQEEGATLSPPNTWSSSSVELDDDSDNRLLFTCTFTLPHGQVLSSAIYAEGFTEQYLPVGSNFMRRLEAKGQSFILSAAAASVKQRIFARINMPDGTPRACELLCEFEKDRAKITVLALRSAFAPSMQPFHVFTFITKHSSTCALTHIDYASIPYLGLLPTDLIGKSLLAFVYAPDVHVVRQAHIDLHNSKGKIVKSIADLRLVAHNGSILRCQTEWSAYVNPWTRKMELVVARHRICTVPIGDADVLAQPVAGQLINVLPQVMAKTFEDELRSIMNRPVPSTSSGSGIGGTPRQFKDAAAAGGYTFAHQAADLGVYIDKLVEHLVVNSTAQQQQKAAARKCAPPPPPPPPAAPATSSEPPLSYTQINCLENVHRLLKSQSRPDSPERDLEPFDERKYPPPLPLTKEVLLQHTKRFEDEYKDTWCRRLKRLSDDVPSSPSPPAKQFRPNVSQTPPPTPAAMNWNLAQKQEFYRNFAPAPPPPPGKNYQITYTPLDDPIIEKSAATPKSDVENHSSAFTAIQKHSTVSSTSTTPTSSSIHPLVQRLIINSPHHHQSLSGGGGSPTSGTNSPPVFPPTTMTMNQLQNSNLHVLRDTNL